MARATLRSRCHQVPATLVQPPGGRPFRLNLSPVPEADSGEADSRSEYPSDFENEIIKGWDGP